MNQFPKKEKRPGEEEIQNPIEEPEESLIKQPRIEEPFPPLSEISQIFQWIETPGQQVSEERPQNPVSEERPQNPVSDERPQNSVSVERPQNPVSEERPQNSVSE